jgi:eukaryotic-like serine/threonine-protein kinase
MNGLPNRDIVIFTEAVQLPANERAAYLARACAGDAELRQKVEALLRTHDHVGDFLETSPQRAAVEAWAKGSAGEKAGDRIGRYKLLQQIGEGGWGVVFMAEQDEPVRRKVALKVVKPGMDTKNVIARFEAEPLRGGAAGPGTDGPSEYRSCPRCRRHGKRPALLRHGVGPGHQDH